MEKSKVIHCCNCARQIVSYTVSNSRCVGPATAYGGCIMLIGDQVVCPECSVAERELNKQMEQGE